MIIIKCSSDVKKNKVLKDQMVREIVLVNNSVNNLKKKRLRINMKIEIKCKIIYCKIQ